MPQDRFWQSKGIYSGDGIPISPCGFWLRFFALGNYRA